MELKKTKFWEEHRKTDLETTEPVSAVELVQNVMEAAVRCRASDIHMEAVKDGVRIRLRVDGRLMDLARYGKEVYPPVIARVKVMADMDISEKRRPQDGRMTFDSGGVEADIRVSSLPTIYGEKLVLRLFYQEIWCRTISELGLSGDELKRMKQILFRPCGLVLVSGPTGSGKSTTLYTALQELNREDINIVTVEEPVEIRLDGISQIPVNTRAGLTFEMVLRSLLRQDPDIIMIGEIRDRETAEIAVQASLTGRLVLSTVHTESAVGSVTRLLDLGVEPYLIADSLAGVAAQRLVRVLCSCKEEREATEEEKRMLKQIKLDSETEILDKENSSVRVCDACGCEQCNGIGYMGRTGIFEIMPVSVAIRSAIRARKDSAWIRRLALEEGMKTLQEQARKLVLEKIISMEEYSRLMGEEEE